MGTTRTLGMPSEPAALMEHLRWLADHPGEVEKLFGRRPSDALKKLPKDSRRQSDGNSRERFIADYSSYARDQDANYGSGLL
jgi:hypothetical protein